MEKSLKIVRFEADANDLTFLKIKKGLIFTADMSSMEGHIVAFFDKQRAKKLIDEGSAEQLDFEMASQFGYTLFAIVGISDEMSYLTLSVDDNKVLEVGGSFANLLPSQYLAKQKAQQESAQKMEMEMVSKTEVAFFPKVD